MPIMLQTKPEVREKNLPSPLPLMPAHQHVMEEVALVWEACTQHPSAWKNKHLTYREPKVWQVEEWVEVEVEVEVEVGVDMEVDVDKGAAFGLEQPKDDQINYVM
jgi:hypothetical protein